MNPHIKYIKYTGMRTFKCDISRRFRGDDQWFGDTYFSCTTMADTPEKAVNNAWYRAAIEVKKLNPNDKRFRAKFARFVEEMKHFDYKCKCVEVEGKTNQGLLSFEDRIIGVLGLA